MATEDLGTLQIGLRADLRQLNTDLANAENAIKQFKVAPKEIRITVREPDDRDIQRVQRKVNSAIERAQKANKIELQPTLSVKEVTVTNFRNDIKRELAKKPIEVPITADVNGEALRDQILGAVGVVDIPLTWHWAGEPPPAGGTGGGPPQPGGPSGGAPVTPTPRPTAPAPAQQAPKEAKTSQPAVAAVPAKPQGKKAEKTPAPPPPTQAPSEAEPKKVTVVPPTAGPGTAPTINAPITRTKAGEPPAGATAEQRLDFRVGEAVKKLTRGEGKGMMELLALGGESVGLAAGGSRITPKTGSPLFKWLTAQPDKGAALEALQTAVDTFGNMEAREPGRQAFTGAARGLAGDLPSLPGGPVRGLEGQVFASSSQRRIAEMVEAEARARKEEFAGRADVQELRAAFKQQGFAAFLGADIFQAKKGESAHIGTGLVRAQQLAEAGKLDEAQSAAIETMAAIGSAFPKLIRQLFPNDPGRVKGAISASKKPKGIKVISPTIINEEGAEVPNPKFNPGVEAVSAAITSIFRDIKVQKIPGQDLAESAERKRQAAERKEAKEAGLVAPTVEPVDTIRQFATPGESAILRAVRKGADPEEAARKAFTRQFGAGEPGQFEAFFSSLDQAALQRAVASAGQGPGETERLRQQIVKDFEKRIPKPVDQTQIKIIEPIGDVERSFARRTSRVPIPRLAGGGPLQVKSGGLMARLAKQGVPLPENAVIVGEKGPEVFVPDQSGHVIDNQGKNLPEWMRRAQEGKLAAKDLTHREAGGPVEGPGSVPTIRYHGPGGLFQRPQIAAAAAIKSGLAQAAPSGSIQRVFVVNWPTGFGFGGAKQQPVSTTAAEPIENLVKRLNILAQQAGAASKGGGKGGGGGGGSAAGGGAAGGGGRGGLGGFSALEEAQLAINRQALITARRLRQTELAGQISAAIREAPTRGIQTATGEILSINIGGLRGVIERRRRATEASTQATAAANLLANAEVKLDKIQLKLAGSTDDKQIKKLTASLTDQQSAVDLLRKNYEGLDAKAQELGKNVIGTGDKIRVFGANTAGIIGGTLLFGATLGLAQAGLEGLSTIMSPIIERMTGFFGATNKVTGALGDQIRASGGAVEQVSSLAYAQTGLSASNANVISGLIDRRSATEAGNKAITEQIELLHAQQNLSREGGQFDVGLVRATGGPFGLDIGATPSTAELVEKELKALPDLVQRQRGQGPQSQLNRIFAGGVAGFGVPGGGLGTNLVGAAVAPPATEESVAAFTERMDQAQKTLDFFNTQAEKGGETQLKLNFLKEGEVNTTAAIAALDPRLKDFGKTLEAQGIEIKGAQKPEDILRFLQAQNATATRPDPQLLIRSLTERIIPNQLAAFEAEANLQLQQTIPAQRALEFLNAPPTPFGAGVVQVGRGTNGALPFGPEAITELQGSLAVDENATNSFNLYRQVATSAIDAVVAKAREGKQALRDMGVPESLITELEMLGNQAQGIELGLANRRAAFDAAQYNRQLFVLNRNLQDAVALTGAQAGAQGTLGRLQRQNFELSKEQNALQLEAQRLSLSLSQRQINFQRALAGFQAPGETGEERAARIEAAKIEADFAQRQLDIQKQLLGLGQRQFVLGVQVFDETARRQVEDLRFALAELQQGRALQLDTTAAQQALAAIRARQAQVNSEIGVAIEKATKKAQLSIATALDIANKSGEAFAKILLQTANAWQVFVGQGATAVTKLLTGASGGGAGGGGKERLKLASGIVGDTLGPTEITVGEARGEKVAVIKNPRALPLRALATGDMAPTGGGGVMVVVDVHDNAINTDSQDAFVAKIARAVEQTMNRKTSLLGLRQA